MKLKAQGEFQIGYNMITEHDGKCKEMMMDFGILKLTKGTVYEDDSKLEKIYLLLYGEIEIEWEDQKRVLKRDSFLDDDFAALNVNKNIKIKIVGISDDAEVAVSRTENDTLFASVLRDKSNSVIETRGKGYMNDAGTRIVKTLMDKKLAPESNIMLGEDVHYPGKWAGFPSHSHNQPEIYYYKFYPENGFGLVKLGDEGVLVEHNDTITIDPDLVHPQVAAPGYAMYFLWIIRHLDGNPYLAPTFEEEHLWVEKPGAKYWPEI
ncbi:5-deoxyglucuronate isomerase [Candidatus Epulonipiscium fishelsonii]|uniref:5-deoxyglucuronate isomerase n=1 Tax=Candidatus Epulonipiscium fishelsonii TaxID=77094 RepID=A0ACC8XCA6_9FIRM|nr:5-deoxyglucuronate isomerase [Epulopiscium sp. SCG-B05WGA-EpuloA1]ONI40085.1 5-deoxyglucuronate isomerase [Epulopiscium sp. SCG-B11WGA-EpuloA1]